MQQMRQIREMIALAMLAISAYTDIKERNIYIMPLVISSSGAVIITLIHMAEAPGDILAKDLIIPVLAGACLIAVIYAYREHIGMGDAYLLATLGLVTGLKQSLYTAAVSVMISSVYAVILLATGRYRRRSGFPFAPFVMAGFFIVLLRRGA